jgi:hypothetical protein
MVVLDFPATKFSVDLLEIEVVRIKLVAEAVEQLLTDRRSLHPGKPHTSFLGRRTGSSRPLLHMPSCRQIVFVNKGRFFVSRDVSQAKTPFVKPLRAVVVIV